MPRIVIIFVITTTLCSWCWSIMGGHLAMMWQPFWLLLILVAIIGSAAASGTLSCWRAVLSDLRRAKCSASDDDTHLRNLVTLAYPGASIERVIAEHRYRCGQTLGSVRLAETAAQTAGIIASILKMIDTLRSIPDSPEVVAWFMASALVCVIYGMVIARGILAPIGDRLTRLYERDSLQLDTLE